MEIEEFVSKYENYPILFVGAGFSKRYLKNTFKWEELLKKCMFDLCGNNEKFLDLKSNCIINGTVDFALLSTKVDEFFNNALIENRNGKFKCINDEYYKLADENIFVSRFKIYIKQLLENNELISSKVDEIKALKDCSKNIATFITTNYDSFIEDNLSFQPVIGNDVFFCNSYGMVYKIHGSLDLPESILITKEDYDIFKNKYELLQAQLISMFINNPIIFIGYSMNDDNIKSVLNTIFKYIDPYSEISKKIRNNFLLVDYCKGCMQVDIVEHDIVLSQNNVIRINKVKTDNFIRIFRALNDIHLPISTMDIRKVQNIVREIVQTNGAIKVEVDTDLDSLDNHSKVLYLGNKKTIVYTYRNPVDFIRNYFDILETKDKSFVEIINNFGKVNGKFPYFMFSTIGDIINVDDLQKSQKEDIEKEIVEIERQGKFNKVKNTIDDVMKDIHIASSYKTKCIFWNSFKRNITLDDLKKYLLSFNKVDSNYRKLLCLLDYLIFNFSKN